jgi:alpha-tubulin suppressor-like RCC1 family protein
MRRRRILLLFTLIACGSSECRLDPSPSCSYRPERAATDGGVEGFADEIDSVRAGDVHACALLSTGPDVFGGEEKRPRCWGGNPDAQLARVASPDPGELWWYVSWDDETGFFELGAAHACVFDLDDADEGVELECWGNNEGGQLGLGPDEDIAGVVSSARAEPDTRVTGLALGGLHGCFGSGEGVSCFGDEHWGQLGVPDPDCCEPTAIPDEAWDGEPFDRVTLVAGTRHSCALLRESDTDAGPVFCWGDDTFGQLGHGAVGDTMVAPARVEDLRASVLAAGPHHGCALGEDGAVRCWGRNERGELGSGDTTSRSTPAPVALHGAVAVFAGGESGIPFGSELDDVVPGAAHSCALDDEGRAFCWGDNSAGQLGLPAGDPALEPVATHPDLRFRDLALGGRFTCGVTLGEELFCWGDNTLGQLGRAGESSHEPTPVAVFRESPTP